MKARTYLSSRIVLAALASIAAQQACAQNVQKVAYSLPAGSARFLKEQVIEVSDVVRLPSDNGVKADVTGEYWLDE